MPGQTVKLKKLSYGVSQKIGNESIKGIDANGNPEIDFQAAQQAKFKKISAALVEPRMTVKQLEALSDDADDIIDELFALVDPKTAEAIEKAKAEKDEGN
jgi:hypothetical protein